MTSSTVRSLRASTEEWSAWQQAADRAGLSLNAWARKALARVSELENALARQDTPKPRPEPLGKYVEIKRG